MNFRRRRLSGDVTVVKEEQQDVKIENDDDGSLPSAKYVRSLPSLPLADRLSRPKGKARRTATSPEIISLLTEDEDEDAPPVWSNKKTRFGFDYFIFFSAHRISEGLPLWNPLRQRQSPSWIVTSVNSWTLFRLLQKQTE